MFTNVINYLRKSPICFCFRSRISPDEIKLCGSCMEPEGLKRKCCNAVYCDHCYTKDKTCPNCHISTRKEKMTGATFALTLFSEHEECRICLEPGLKRRCCGNYYCDECYYSRPNCRSCNTPVSTKRPVFEFTTAALISILVGWMATFFIIAGIIIMIGVISASEARIPQSLSEFKCYGFFRQCDVEVCIDVNASVATGKSSIPPLNTWSECNLNSEAKLQSKACVFDEELYTLSDRSYGYDVCQDEFSGGIVIFEDKFEAWQNLSFKSNLMKSALWDNIVNGFATPNCDVPKKDGGKNALTFSGEQLRTAVTKDLDVSSGGWITAEIFLAAVNYDSQYPLCKSNFAGSVDLEYSINGGRTWELIFHFVSFEWRSKYFHSVQFDIPKAAKTISTRFRFHQPTFEAARDAWALDNVRVFRKLPSDWDRIGRYKTNINEGRKVIQRAQCCFDTDWCETRLSLTDMNKCYKQFDSYHGREYQLRSAELYICLVVLFNILKFIYISVHDWLIKRRFPFQDEVEDILNSERILKYIPMEYRPKKTLASLADNSHMLARLAIKDMGEGFMDDEGQGERLKQQAEIEEEKRIKNEKRQKKLLKIKKKLQKRKEIQLRKEKNTRKFRGKVVIDGEEEEKDVIDEEINDQSDEENNEEKLRLQNEKQQQQEASLTKFGSDSVASELDKFKRQSLAMLRVPFDMKVSEQWRLSFAMCTIGILTITLLYKAATTTYYVVHQKVRPYGAFDGDISLTSLGLNFLALCCDFKELYHTLKYVVPLRNEWLPLITVDRTEDINSLFIGRYHIRLPDINNIRIFGRNFAFGCAFAYFIGSLPWCLFSLIVRDQYLEYSSMRIVTPIIATIIMLRAIMGPAFIIKSCYTTSFLLSINMHVRERVGLACQSAKTRNSALHASVAITVIGTFIVAAVAVSWTGIMFGVFLAGGLIYGAMTGFSHDLPIKPWMYLTTLKGGFSFRLKRKQGCPCKRSFLWCTDMHTVEEVCVMFTTDDVKFISLLKLGAESAEQHRGGDHV